jgi:hypothetical protein
VSPEELVEIRDDLYFWIDSGHAARDNLDRVLSEVHRLCEKNNDLRDALDRSQEDRTNMRAQVDAVLNIHKPSASGSYCLGCWEIALESSDVTVWSSGWPCATARALGVTDES